MNKIFMDFQGKLTEAIAAKPDDLCWSLDLSW